MTTPATPCDLLVVGGGPAGLAAALAAAPAHRVLLAESGSQLGGLARTLEYDGNLLDVGGHRFLTEDPQVQALWRDLLGDELREVPRQSRILYQGRTFEYPLQVFDALSKLGPIQSLRVVASYLRSLLRPVRGGHDLESWLVARFGWQLYRIFFKSYSEKLWGRPCSKIHASWASQRIRGLSLARAAYAALTRRSDERTLADRFLYPSRGPGQMWQAMADRIEAAGGEIWLDAEVTEFQHNGSRITEVAVLRRGERLRLQPRQVIATAPLTSLLHRVRPAPPDEVQAAASMLAHRAFVVVHLIVAVRDLFRDQWLYVHSPQVQVGRIQNIGNWSPDMVREAGTSVLGFEYFCDVDDPLWSRTDASMVQLAVDEGVQLGLLRPETVLSGHVVREPHAYPVYPLDLEARLRRVRDYLGQLKNLRVAGRSAQHRYGNMDEAMIAGQQAARSIDDPTLATWPEEMPASLVDALPAQARAVLVRTFARLDEFSFALASGAVLGLLLLAMTLTLVVKGGERVGPTLSLLVHYLPGYSVTYQGAVTALGLGLLWGFLFGWLFATVRNLLLAAHVFGALRKARGWTLRHFLDQL
ncbi:MAG: FAD-dependent oxidoreductase [Pseudomonadota bacterium]